MNCPTTNKSETGIQQFRLTEGLLDSTNRTRQDRIRSRNSIKQFSGPANAYL